MGCDNNDSNFSIYEDSTKVLTVETGGYVGIGTTNPTRQLDLYGSTGNALMSIRAGTTAAGGIFFYDGGTEMFDLQYKNSDDKFYLTSSASESTGIIIQRSNGYVGINDSSPSYALDVNGTFRVVGASVFGNISSNLYPSADSTYSLGDNTTRWSSIFADTLYGNGANITSLSGSSISSGTVAAARLGSGSSITSKFLRGDNTWQTVSSGGSGTVTSVATTGAITGGTITTTGTIAHSTSAGYKHVPTGGSSKQYLKYSSSGTAVWSTVAWEDLPDISTLTALP